MSSPFKSKFLSKSPIRDGLTTATNYVSNSVIPKVKEIKAKVGTRIRKIAGMGPNIPKRSKNKMK